jgi:hypothetical protein
MHPLVRDLYKRIILVGRDYPLGLEYVRTQWKKALRNPDNCPSCYNGSHQVCLESVACERELRKAVGKGRHYVREMIGVIQFKKYRAMKKRYEDDDRHHEMMQRRMQEIVTEALVKVAPPPNK